MSSKPEWIKWAKWKAGMFKIPKQECTAGFKELAVKRVKSGETVARLGASNVGYEFR